MYMHLCLWNGMFADKCKCLHKPKIIEFLRDGVIGSCKLLPGNQTQVLC